MFKYPPKTYFWLYHLKNLKDIYVVQVLPFTYTPVMFHGKKIDINDSNGRVHLRFEFQGTHLS